MLTTLGPNHGLAHNHELGQGGLSVLEQMSKSLTWEKKKKKNLDVPS